MQLSRLYSNQDALFEPIAFNAGERAITPNVIFAEVKRKKAKESDSHNLGKSTLIELVDFLLLKEITSSDHFLDKHKERFSSFIFYLELLTHSGDYVTVRRSVADPTAISLKRSKNSISDIRGLADGDWDHFNMSLSSAKEALDAYLDLKMIRPFDYRTGVSYFLRTQKDYEDYFQIQKFMQGKHRAWKPYLACVLGLNYEAVGQKYELEDELAEKQQDRDKRIAEIDAANQDRGELATRIEIARDELAEIDNRLDGFDFHEAEEQINKRVVEAVEKRIGEITSELYDVRVDIAQLDSSLTTGVKFDLKRIKQIFDESQLLLPESVVKSYEDLLQFNQKLTRERNREIKARIRELSEIRDKLELEHEEQSAERQRLLAILQQADTFKKYKALQSEQSQRRANISHLETQLARLDTITSIDRDIRELKTRLDATTTAIENSLEKDSPLRTGVTRYFNRYVKQILGINGEFIVSTNTSGNIDFSIKTKDVTGADTSQDKGHSYHRMLCALFDLAVLKAMEDSPFYHFVYHDGIFEGLANNMKVRMLELIREVTTSKKIQYMFSIIDSDLPHRIEDDSIIRFSSEEIVLTLHDQGDQGRLFKMPPF